MAAGAGSKMIGAYLGVGDVLRLVVLEFGGLNKKEGARKTEATVLVGWLVLKRDGDRIGYIHAKWEIKSGSQTNNT